MEKRRTGSFSLKADLGSMERSRSGTVWGGVWVELEGEPFPEAMWNDMSVAFVNELVAVVDELRSPRFESKTVRFFDGPMWLEFVVVEEGVLAVSSDGEGESRHTVSVAVEAFVADVERTAREVHAGCTARGWGEDDDVRRLEALMRRTF